MNSAELPASSQFSIDTSRWDDVRRIYRRVCLLRATGKSDQAAELQNAEFSRALSAARTASEAGEMEAAVLAEEAERVSTACILAELIAPLLADKLRGEVPLQVAADAPARATKPLPADPITPRAPAPAAVPGIADLIDGMLSQENAFSGGRAR